MKKPKRKSPIEYKLMFDREYNNNLEEYIKIPYEVAYLMICRKIKIPVRKETVLDVVGRFPEHFPKENEEMNNLEKDHLIGNNV